MRTPSQSSCAPRPSLVLQLRADALTLAGGSPILRTMETGYSRSPGLAALLSALLPGLGQFYNRQWSKGGGFLLGFLILARALLGSVDLQALQQSADSGVPVDNIGQLATLMLLLLALAVWSVVDAARSAKKSLQ